MFKYKKDQERIFHCHPILLMILFDMKSYFDKHNFRFEITSTVSTLEEDKKLGRVSSTHRSGRAVDLSIRELDVYQVNTIRREFNAKYAQFAAISPHTGKPNLVVVHTGTAPHIHLQIHSRYSREIDLVAKVKNSKENKSKARNKEVVKD